MNTNQIMSMPGGVQVSRKASLVQSRGKANYEGKNGSFNDALTKSKGDSLTLQDVKELADSAKVADAEAKMADAAKGASTEADTPKESNTKNKIENTDASANSKNVEPDAPEEIVDADVAVKVGAVVLALIAQSLNTEDVDINSALNEALPKDMPNLQSILPQSGEMMGKNQEMLNMLAGLHLPKPEAKLDLMGFDFKNLDLSDLNLGELNLKNLDLSSLNLGNLDLKNLDLSGLDLKTLNFDGLSLDDIDTSVKDALKSIGEAVMTLKDLAAVVRENAPDALSQLIAKMTEFVGTKVISDTKPSSDAPINNLINGNNFVDARHFANAKVVNVAESVVNNMEAGMETAQQIVLPDAKTIDIKAQPLAANLQNAKTQTENINPNPLMGTPIKAEDAEAFPIRETFANFGQNADGDENQSLLSDNNRNNIFKTDNTTETGGERVESNGQFAHTLETHHNQQTANTRETAPTTVPPRDIYNVREQIVQQARLVRTENATEMVIRLKPEHLGDMTLRISVSSEGSVTASFFTNNAEVRHIVENSLVQLRQELQNQGIKVDKTEVYSGLSDGSLPQGQGQEAWQQNQSQSSSGSRFQNTESGAAQFEENAVDVATNNGISTLANDGVDYLV